MAVGIPSFPARDSIICLFAELNCAIVVAIRPRQRPYDVALTHRCPNSVEITALAPAPCNARFYHCVMYV